VLSIRVEGEFLESYWSGDNRAILPSDTLRRHAMAERAANPATDPIALVEPIARRILAANPALERVSIDAVGQRWVRRGRHTFTSGGLSETAHISIGRDGAITRTGGVTGVQLLSTTGSAFTGFMRDELTVQTESLDRPLCGTLDATWTWAEDSHFSPAVGNDDIAERLIDACADRPSNAVQELLASAARTVLEQTNGLTAISMRFASLPIAANVFDGDPASHQSHEVGTGPLGVTEVTITRAHAVAAPSGTKSSDSEFMQ